MKRIWLFILSLSLCYCSFAQNKSSLYLKVPIRHEWHTFNVDYGPPSTKGEQQDNNTRLGVGLGYSIKVLKAMEASIGLDYSQYKSKILRVYNRRYWNDFTAILNYTDDTRYNLLSIPVGIDYIIKQEERYKILVGTSFNLNYTFSNKYGMKGTRKDHLSRFYFFGFSNQLSVAFRHNFLSGKFIEFRPFLSTFERWRKDEVLYEDNNDFHDMDFNAIGANISIGIDL